MDAKSQIPGALRSRVVFVCCRGVSTIWGGCVRSWHLLGSYLFPIGAVGDASLAPKPYSSLWGALVARKKLGQAFHPLLPRGISAAACAPLWVLGAPPMRGAAGRIRTLPGRDVEHQRVLGCCSSATHRQLPLCCPIIPFWWEFPFSWQFAPRPL